MVGFEISTAEAVPTPGLAAAFTLRVRHAEPLQIGRLSTGGSREYQPVLSGMFSGRGVEGRILSGGEMRLCRPDAVTVVEADYLIAVDDAAVRLIGTGYETADGPFVGTRMTMAFEADEGGPHAWLCTRVFLAERATAGDLFVIVEVT